MPNLVLRFDMRNWRHEQSSVDLYRAAIEMAVWAEERGFQTVQFAEHHGSADGYLPSPIVLAAAIAARTSRIRLRFGLIILPLYHPIKLAEDLARDAGDTKKKSSNRSMRRRPPSSPRA